MGALRKLDRQLLLYACPMQSWIRPLALLAGHTLTTSAVPSTLTWGMSDGATVPLPDNTHGHPGTSCKAFYIAALDQDNDRTPLRVCAGSPTCP